MHIEEVLRDPSLSAELKKIRLLALHALRAGIAADEPEVKKAALQEAQVWAVLHLGSLFRHLENVIDSHLGSRAEHVPATIAQPGSTDLNAAASVHPTQPH